MSFTRKKFLESVTYHEEDWDELQDNIGNYYDPLVEGLRTDVDAILADYLTSTHRIEADPHPYMSMDYIKQGENWKKITITEKGHYDIVYNAFGGSPSMDNIPQGTGYKKLSALQYSVLLSSFTDPLVSPTTLTLGYGANIAAYFFANGADADGGNIYANDILSRGKPVYALVFASPWHQIAAESSLPATAHNLGYRPSFAMVQISNTNPDGQPEDYIYTEGYGSFAVSHTLQNYAAWNNMYYRIYNNSTTTYYFRVLMFAYLGE